MIDPDFYAFRMLGGAALLVWALAPHMRMHASTAPLPNPMWDLLLRFNDKQLEEAFWESRPVKGLLLSVDKVATLLIVGALCFVCRRSSPTAVLDVSQLTVGAVSGMQAKISTLPGYCRGGGACHSSIAGTTNRQVSTSVLAARHFDARTISNGLLSGCQQPIVTCVLIWIHLQRSAVCA